MPVEFLNDHGNVQHTHVGDDTNVIYRDERFTQMYTTELEQTQQEVIKVWFVMRRILRGWPISCL